MRRREIITLIVLVFSTIWGLSAQNTDTMYVVKKHIVRDTVYVRDTLRVQDTIIIADYIHSEEFKQLFYELNGADAQTPPDSLQKLWAQTVTFLENRVIQYEQQNVSTMDSIKKYGLAGLLLLGLNSLAPAQTEAPQTADSPHIKTESVLHDSPFNGFHFGYTLEADIVHPVEMISYATAQKSFSSRYGGRLGLECSYHFADYFGVSAALDVGIINNAPYRGISYYGVSMPLKFEFHYPVANKLWITANAGVQLRMPWRTFLYDYDYSDGHYVNITTYDSTQVTYLNLDAVYNRNVFYADIMADVGLYYQLPNQDYLRFLVGLNIATTDFSKGLIDELTPNCRYFFERNHYLYFQIAYLHGFSKQRTIQQSQPHWNADKLLSRHEFRLGVSDHFGFLYRWTRQYTTFDYGGERVSCTSADYHFTPVISLDYHYRATKWFWLGLSTSYSFMKEKLYVGNVVSPDAFYWNCKEHHFLIMPSLRFSYLNRPHVTLYSGIAVGVLINRGNRYYGNLSELPEFVPAAWGFVPAELPDHTSAGSAFQLTAFGLKAGGNHWFGSLELGAGIKGFVNLGVGYEF